MLLVKNYLRDLTLIKKRERDFVDFKNDFINDLRDLSDSSEDSMGYSDSSGDLRDYEELYLDF